MIVAPVPGKKLPPVLESAPLASSVPLPRETVPLERVKLAFAVRRPGPVRLKLPKLSLGSAESWTSVESCVHSWSSGATAWRPVAEP